MSKRSALLLLGDILESINRIEEYTIGMQLSDFREQQMAVDAVIRNFEVIGEAASALPEMVLKELAEIEWRKVIGLRNVLIHQYFGVDVEIVWNIIQNDLSVLKEKIILRIAEYDQDFNI